MAVGPVWVQCGSASHFSHEVIPPLCLCQTEGLWGERCVQSGLGWSLGSGRRCFQSAAIISCGGWEGDNDHEWRTHTEVESNRESIMMCVIAGRCVERGSCGVCLLSFSSDWHVIPPVISHTGSWTNTLTNTVYSALLSEWLTMPERTRWRRTCLTSAASSGIWRAWRWTWGTRSTRRTCRSNASGERYCCHITTRYRAACHHDASLNINRYMKKYQAALDNSKYDQNFSLDWRRKGTFVCRQELNIEQHQIRNTSNQSVMIRQEESLKIIKKIHTKKKLEWLSVERTPRTGGAKRCSAHGRRLHTLPLSQDAWMEALWELSCNSWQHRALKKRDSGSL